MKILPIFLREIITNSLTLLPNQISRFIREVVQQGQAKKKIRYRNSRSGLTNK
jgi:hypothetical protein